MRPHDKRFKGMRKVGSTGKLSEGRLAWMRLNLFTLVWYQKPDGFLKSLPEELQPEYEKHTEGDGDHISIAITVGNSKVVIPLTSFTAHELRAMKHFINSLIDESLPIAEARDRLAVEALEDYDDDTNIRVYRGLPELFVRKGSLGEYNPRLLDGLTGDDLVVRKPGAARSLAESVSEMADEDEEHDGSEDDEPPLDFSKGVWALGKD